MPMKNVHAWRVSHVGRVGRVRVPETKGAVRVACQKKRRCIGGRRRARTGEAEGENWAFVATCGRVAPRRNIPRSKCPVHAS